MAIQTKRKLNQLYGDLPEGLLADAAWLEREGYYRSLRSQYVASGWLRQPVRGVFSRSRGEEIEWEQVIVSLQSLMGYGASIGGRTALELQGFAHYLSRSQPHVHLYTHEKLPAWLHKLPIQTHFITHNVQRLLPYSWPEQDLPALESRATESDMLPGALRTIRWGQWKWPIVISTPERAYLELLDELPNNETFHMADVIMEGLVTISPRRMQNLLKEITSIKVKRLFFFFADRHQHQWLKRIERDKIDLGSGKRMLIKGGKFDPIYSITVPAEMMREDTDGF